MSCNWNGNIPWLSSGDIKSAQISDSSEKITKRGLEQSTANMCRPGSILVVVRSGILKHTLPVAVLECDAAINQDIKAFDSGDDRLNRWLALAWRASARELLSENREGTTVQSVKIETLNNYELFVPPLAEQKRIVAKVEKLLEKVDASRVRLDKIATILKRFRQSVLAAACSGRLTADWRAEKNSDYEWPVRKLGELGSVSGGITKNSNRRSLQMQVPYLRVANVYANRLELDEVHIIGVTLQEFKRTRLEKNDLLFVEGNGSMDQIGRVALWNESIPRCVHQNHLIKFRAGKTVMPVYVLFQMMSPGGREQLVEKSSSSAGLNTLSISKISDINLPVPPLIEQREIIRRMGKMFALADRLEARVGKARGQVDKLTQAILAKAFRGELVPQDPNDEPAEKLLARIRAKNERITAKGDKATALASIRSGRPRKSR